MRSIAEVKDQFAYHPATSETAKTHDQLRVAYAELAVDIWGIIPDGPEKTVVFRKLQESLMYANLAVALQAPLAADGTSGIARELPRRPADSP